MCNRGNPHDSTHEKSFTGSVAMAVTYSHGLVALARSLDAAEVATRAALWHFDDIDADEPEKATHSHELTRAHINNFAETLPALRALFLSLVRQESPGWKIEPNGLGDACPPAEVTALFRPVIDTQLRLRQIDGQPPSQLLALPEEVRSSCGDRRAIFFDGDLFIIPHEFDDSFVEVWFRRALSYWPDGGAYPLYLTKRAYGWQAYGIER